MGTIGLFVSGALWAGGLPQGQRRRAEALAGPLVPRADVPAGALAPSARQAKSTIDTVMDRLGDGSAGVLQLLITAGLGLGLQRVAGAPTSSWSRSGSSSRCALRCGLRQPARHGAGPARRTRRGTARGRGRRHPPGPGDDPARGRRVGEGRRAGVDRAQRRSGRRKAAARPGPRRRLAGGAQRRAGTAARAATTASCRTSCWRSWSRRGRRFSSRPSTCWSSRSGNGCSERLEELLDRAGETTRLSVVAFMLRRLGPEFEPFARQVFDALLAPRRAAGGAGRRGARAGAAAAGLRRCSITWIRRLDDPTPLVAGGRGGDGGAGCGRTDLIPRMIALLARPPLRQARAPGPGPVLGEQLRARSCSRRWKRRDPLGGRPAAPAPAAGRALHAADGGGAGRARWMTRIRGSARARWKRCAAIRRCSPEIRPLAYGPAAGAAVRADRRSTRSCSSVEDALRDDPDADERGLVWLVDALESERFRSWAASSCCLRWSTRSRTWRAAGSPCAAARRGAGQRRRTAGQRAAQGRKEQAARPAGALGAPRGAGLAHPARPACPAARRCASLIEGDDPWIAACALYAASPDARRPASRTRRSARPCSPHAVLREEADGLSGRDGAR